MLLLLIAAALAAVLFRLAWMNRPVRIGDVIQFRYLVEFRNHRARYAWVPMRVEALAPRGVHAGGVLYPYANRGRTWRS